MSIEMDNPESLPGKIDAAWNLVEQIGIALSIGDVAHAKEAKGKVSRLLSLAMQEAGEQEYDGPGVIRAERARQIAVEGWTPQHDDAHASGEMAKAAACYAEIAHDSYGIRLREIPTHWPWSLDWWKPSEDPIRNLEKAGALIAAEIERLQRLEAYQSGLEDREP